jgi:hypothetical protein
VAEGRSNSGQGAKRFSWRAIWCWAQNQVAWLAGCGASRHVQRCSCHPKSLLQLVDSCSMSRRQQSSRAH